MTSEELQEIQSEIDSIESDFRSLHSKVQLTSVRDKVENINGDTKAIERMLASARKRGYPFEKDLEGQIKEINDRWQGMHDKIRRRIDQESRDLKTEMDSLENKVNRLVSVRNNRASATSKISSTRSAVQNLESRVEAAENVVSSMYESLDVELYILYEHLEQIEWAQEQIDEACFSLIATEAVIMAVEATWVEGKEDKNDPKGVLYLTDQRLIVEQKQEVASKKVLFIATEKKMVQELIFEVPLSLVTDVEASKRGMFKNEDHIELEFASGATKPAAHLHIFYQPCEHWQLLIKRVRDGEFDKDRAVELDEEVLEKVKEAPTVCEQCGGTFTQPVMRGQDTISCEFCGAVVRL